MSVFQGFLRALIFRSWLNFCLGERRPSFSREGSADQDLLAVAFSPDSAQLNLILPPDPSRSSFGMQASARYRGHTAIVLKRVQREAISGGWCPLCDLSAQLGMVGLQRQRRLGYYSIRKLSCISSPTSASGSFEHRYSRPPSFITNWQLPHQPKIPTHGVLITRRESTRKGVVSSWSTSLITILSSLQKRVILFAL